MRPLLAVCLLTLSLFAASARDALVYVNNASAELSPGETINIRFTTPMYKAGEEGERPPRPVDLSPSIASVFEWTSPVSGVIRFTAPPKLDTKYAITPRPDLKDASGAPVDLDRTRPTSLQTPAAKLVRHLVHPREFNPLEDDEKRRLGTSRTPVIYVAFNSTFPVPNAIQQISFISDHDERIPAAGAKPPNHLSSMAASDRPWISAWTENKHSPCSMFISPASPLIPGRRWSIELPSNLVGNSQPIPIGYVHPFRLVNTRFERIPFEPTKLIVQLSHYVPLPKPDPIKQNALEHALKENQISQAAHDSSLALENITLSVNNGPASVINVGGPHHAIAITTPAKAGDLLKVNIPALHTPDGQTLPPTVIERRVPKLAPRLMLTGELVRHAPKDQREIELLCVRVPRVRLSIHHIPKSTAAKAFELWSKTYSTTEEQPSAEPTPQESPTRTLARIKGGPLKLRVDPEQLGGNQIFEQIIEPNYDSDEATIHRTPWSNVLGANSTGMYLVTAEEFDPERTIQRPLRNGVQQLVQRSDLSVQLLNSGTLSALCIANSATSGNPLPGVTCAAFDASWKRIKEVVTGPEGTATFDAGNVAFIQASRENEVLIFQSGGGFHVGQENGDESALPIQSLLFTDRNIYRPSETAHAKFIVRETAPGTLRPQKNSRQPWDLKGPRGRTVDSGHLDLSDRGSGNIDIRLPDTPGSYVLSIGEERSRLFNSIFLTVAEFEPDAFEINLKAPEHLTCPTPATVDIEAHYLSGLPLSAANARWKLTLTKAPFRPLTAPDHAFHTYWHDWRLEDSDRNNSETLEDSVVLEKNGKSQLSIAMPLPEDPIRRKASLSVEITDAENQTLASETGFLVDCSDFYLGVKRPAAWRYQKGKSIPISVIAVAPNGKSIAPPNPVEMSVQQLHWKSTITKTPSGERVEYSYELGPVHSVPVTVTSLPVEHDQILVPKSHQSVDLSFLEVGEYIAAVTTNDGSDRLVSTEFSFAIHEGNAQTTQPTPDRPEEDEDEPRFFFGDFPLKVVSDKTVYAPGETAVLSLRSPVHGTATLCLGTQPILQVRTFQVHPGLNGIELPVTESLIPGNQLTLTIVESLPPGTPAGQSARSATTSIPLIVHPSDERLNVSIVNLPQDARPRTTLSPTVTVTDTVGHPVADAEVTLFAVDEGVLRLSGYTTPNPNAALYPTGFRSLQHISSRNIIRSWDIWDVRQRFANKGYLVGGGGEDASGMRNSFEFTPLWIPAARTNAKGVLKATFKVPDNVTAYRVMAVVHHGNHRFGKAETNLRVNKPLQIQPGTPQFVKSGDTVEIRCSVQNTTPSPISIELTFDPTGGAEVSSPKKITASLPENSTTPFNFRTSFTQPGDIELKWTARSTDGKESDGLRIPLTIRSPFPARHQSVVTRITNKPFDPTEAIDAELLEGQGEAAISLSRDPAIQLEGMIDSLLHYPYGCAEQTMSSMFPWILAKSFPVKHLRNESRRNAIQQGLQRLSSMLTPDGSVAYWPINSSGVRQPRGLENWLTAYVGLGLALIRQDSDPIVAQAAGEELETPIFDHLKALLSKPDTARIDDDALCLGACALAIFGKPDHAANERLLAKADQLNATDRALLAIAMHTSKTASSTTLSSLFQPVPEKDTSTPFLSQHRERATRLLGLSICGLLPEEQASLFQELVSGAEFGRHQTTQDHVWRLIAARFHLAAQDVGDKPTSLTWNFAASKSDETLTKNNPTSTHSLRWNGKNNRLKPASIKRTNDAPLFASIKVSSTPIETQAPQNQGFNLDRVILPPSEKPLKIGDLVKIKVTVDVHQPSAFVALECPLPSLLEPLQGFETRGKKDLVPTAMGSSHSETRADRILFFWDEMPPGKYTAFAYARVRASGDASIPAARIEEMYRPQRFSETAVERLVIP